MLGKIAFQAHTAARLSQFQKARSGRTPSVDGIAFLFFYACNCTVTYAEQQSNMRSFIYVSYLLRHGFNDAGQKYFVHL